MPRTACLSLQRVRVVWFRFAKVDGAFHHSGSPRNGALAGIEPSSLRSSTVVRTFAANYAANRTPIHRTFYQVKFTASASS